MDVGPVHDGNTAASAPAPPDGAGAPDGTDASGGLGATGTRDASVRLSRAELAAAAHVPTPAPPATSRPKRAFDVAVVLATAPLTLPVGLLVSLAIRLTSKGPALFRQGRVGLSGNEFRMFKFRTMVHDAEDRLQADPALWAEYVRNDYKLPASTDPRMTRLGRILRRSSLDELPQLLNVLAGSMSLVGPRPVTRAQYDAFIDVVGAYRAVRPGMTGHWQVNGRSDVHYPERALYDRSYVDEWSLWFDLSILVRTPLTVVRGRGAY